MLWKIEFKLFYTREIRNQVYHKSNPKVVLEINLMYVDIEIATCFALVESLKAKFFSKNPMQWCVSCKLDFRHLPWKKGFVYFLHWILTDHSCFLLKMNIALIYLLTLVYQLSIHKPQGAQITLNCQAGRGETFNLEAYTLAGKINQFCDRRFLLILLVKLTCINIFLLIFFPELSWLEKFSPRY